MKVLDVLVLQNPFIPPLMLCQYFHFPVWDIEYSYKSDLYILSFQIIISIYNFNLLIPKVYRYSVFLGFCEKRIRRRYRVFGTKRLFPTKIRLSAILKIKTHLLYSMVTIEWYDGHSANTAKTYN